TKRKEGYRYGRNMKNIRNRENKLFPIVLMITIIVLIIAAITPGVMGASKVDLGAAENFGVLAKTGISTTGSTMITGVIGVSPIDSTAITGFGLIMDPTNQFSSSTLVRGKVYAANYMTPTPDLLITAVSNMETAFTDAAGRVPPDGTELYAGNLGGRTLTPGLYKWSSGVLVPTSTDLTLDAQGNNGAVWIFQVAGDLTMNSASHIRLINGAESDNIYWQIAGPTGVAIGSDAHVEGNILAKKAITMNSGASLHGRALAQTAVTLISSQQT
ncbi:MAG TPA: ice-binding family protein, partial [Methanospirillum sp.]|nr:ice-binding family protein [Methanospirillum sp.]